MIETVSTASGAGDQPFVNFDEISFCDNDKVGQGAYGVVYKARWRGQIVAVKKFNVGADEKAIKTEIKQLSRVRHDNIISLYGISSAQQCTFLIMEFAEGGSLHTFLHGNVKPEYSEAHAVSWVRQCAEGVAYLHAMKPKPLIHRDLKPLNLLLTNKGRLLKICDFGTVVDKATLMSNSKGTPAWMAPEVFKADVYNEKCDTFSWSIVLWEVFAREQPFKELPNSFAVLWHITKYGRPKHEKEVNWPENIRELMHSCWDDDPDKRPTMQRVVERMNEIAALYPDIADKPIEYEYVNQKIILPNSNDAVDKSNHDFGNLTSSNHVTPTNVGSHSNFSTPTPINELSSAIESESYQNIPSQIPIASITSSRRWEVIDESTESPVFNLMANADGANRIAAIRNEMFQNRNIQMAPISVLVDPSAWDLGYNDASAFSKSDGRKRLTVTDTKPEIHSNPMQSDDDLSNDSDDTNPEEQENYTLDPSLLEMLDADLRPEQSLPDYPESMKIYSEHLRLAKDFLLVDTQICEAMVSKEKLLDKMDPFQRAEKTKMIEKVNAKEELLALYNNLKQQRESLSVTEMAVGGVVTIANKPNAPLQRQVSQESNMADEDGWVVVPP